MVSNIHSRELRTSLAEAGRLIDNLASDQDCLWPKDVWPPMLLDRPLGVGAAGGHGPIGYVVEAYEPGRLVRFRFTHPEGLAGTHAFDLAEAGPGVVRLRHTVEAELSGGTRLTWPLAIRWLHDALTEDALDRAEAWTLGRPVQQRRWSPWVKFLKDALRRRAQRARDRNRP